MSLTSGDTLHVLFLTATLNQSEDILNLIRNSGTPIRGHTVSSHEAFSETVRESRWDAIVVDPDLNTIEYRTLLKQLVHLQLDIPLILIPEKLTAESQNTALSEGAAAVVAASHGPALMHTLINEVQHLRDRQSLRKLEIMLQEAERRSETLLQNSEEPFAYIQEGIHIFANPAYLRLFGIDDADELDGMPMLDMVSAGSQTALKDLLKTTEVTTSPELEFVTLEGEPAFSASTEFSAILWEGEECLQVKITDLPSAAAEPAETETAPASPSEPVVAALYSETYIREHLDSAIAAAVMQGRKSILIYLLAQARTAPSPEQQALNISALISGLSQTDGENALAGSMNEGDIALLIAVPEGQSATEVLEKARSDLEALLPSVNGDYCGGLSVITPNSHADIALRQAMDAASQATATEPLVYSEEVAASSESQPDMEILLTEALAENRLKLMFQPLVSMRGDDNEHYEVLLRVNNGQEDISVGEFLVGNRISDELKCKIDRWVVLSTCRTLVQQGARSRSTRVFINLCGASLADDGLVPWVRATIANAKLNPSSLVLQIAEEDASRHTAKAKKFLYQVQASQILSSISHFGCSLSHEDLLKTLKLDYVKIDGSYIQELTANPGESKELMALLKKVHESERISIVPCIESAATVSRIWQFGIHFIQGYYVQGPLSAMSYDFSEEAEEQ